MNAPIEKDYIDAKLQAVIERLNGEAKAHQISTDARLDKLDQTVEFGLKSVREESAARYAQLEASFYRSQSETVKWIVGAILASTAVSVSTIALLVHLAISKPAAPVPTPAPIVIYPERPAVPAPAPST